MDEQMIYCFTIYDLNDDGFISKEEMLTMMKTCLVKQGGNEDDGEEGVKVTMEVKSYRITDVFVIQDLIDMTLKKMDHDKDGRVSYSDFEETVKREPLMMEAFGQCLPNNRIGFEFMGEILDSRPNNSFFHN